MWQGKAFWLYLRRIVSIWGLGPFVPAQGAETGGIMMHWNRHGNLTLAVNRTTKLLSVKGYREKTILMETETNGFPSGFLWSDLWSGGLRNCRIFGIFSGFSQN